MRRPDKISIGQAARQGDTFLTFWCETPRREPARYSHAVNTCGHHADIDIRAALSRWGPDRRLSDIRAVCTVCGGRVVDVRSGHPPLPGKQGV